MTDLVLREFESVGDFAQALEVARAAWHMGDRELSARADLIAITHAGGLSAGVFRGRRLLGFVHGFPRTNLGRPCHHSHLLAVRPEAQGQGLSVQLKFFQRRWCLNRRVGLVTWTYDPLLVKNARLNLVRLRAKACRFHRDFYGPMGGIYGNHPTDRFEIFWDLLNPEVRAAARGRLFPEPDLESAVRIPLRSPRLPARLASEIAVEIPLDIVGLSRSDRKAAERIRRRFRRIAEELIAKGYEAVSIGVEAERGVYLFRRPR